MKERVLRGHCLLSTEHEGWFVLSPLRWGVWLGGRPLDNDGDGNAVMDKSLRLEKNGQVFA